MTRTRSSSRSRNKSGRETDRFLRPLVSALLAWFALNARDLPWRRRPSPYAIWVSEVMLQQTQVKTVVPYWKRWMEALPTVRSLARARPETVLKLWEGLGYYRRARNLHEAARIIMARHAGRFPQDFTSLLALPGIGRYTAGAICSIAFNQPTPAVDGNVARVLSRLFGVPGSPADKRTSQRLWQLATDLVQTASRLGPLGTAQKPPRALPREVRASPVQHPAACAGLNPALMELGALVCLPRHAQCPICPVRGFCVARRTNRVRQLPRPAARPSTVPRQFLAFVLEHERRFLVQQRPSGVANAHLWQFPNVELTHHDLAPARRWLAPLGLQPAQLTPLLTVRHVITRYRITLESCHARLPRLLPARVLPGRWLPLEKLSLLPFASAHRKIVNHLRLRLAPCTSRSGCQP